MRRTKMDGQLVVYMYVYVHTRVWPSPLTMCNICAQVWHANRPFCLHSLCLPPSLIIPLSTFLHQHSGRREWLVGMEVGEGEVGARRGRAPACMARSQEEWLGGGVGWRNTKAAWPPGKGSLLFIARKPPSPAPDSIPHSRHYLPLAAMLL